MTEKDKKALDATNTGNPFWAGSDGKRRLPDVEGNAALLQAIHLTMQAGKGFFIGHTSDGGAIAITIFDGNSKHKAWAANQAELDSAIHSIIQAYL